MPPPAPAPVPTPKPVRSPRQSSEGNIRVPCQQTVFGIDIYHGNPVSDWAQVASKCKFVFLKATEGTGFVDPTFSERFKDAKSAGLYVGAYHYFHAGEDVDKQIQNFLGAIGSPLDPIDMVALDFEVRDGQLNDVAYSNALYWLLQVKKTTGKVPLLYTDPGFWNGLGNPQAFYGFPLWIANPEAANPDIPPPWWDCLFWQCSFSATVAGCPDRVDADFFNGTADQLRAFIQSGTLP